MPRLDPQDAMRNFRQHLRAIYHLSVQFDAAAGSPVQVEHAVGFVDKIARHLALAEGLHTTLMASRSAAQFKDLLDELLEDAPANPGAVLIAAKASALAMMDEYASLSPPAYQKWNNTTRSHSIAMVTIPAGMRTAIQAMIPLFEPLD